MLQTLDSVDGQKPGGRLRFNPHDSMGIRSVLVRRGDVDSAVVAWLRRAYAAPEELGRHISCVRSVILVKGEPSRFESKRLHGARQGGK